MNKKVQVTLILNLASRLRFALGHDNVQHTVLVSGSSLVHVDLAGELDGSRKILQNRVLSRKPSASVRVSCWTSALIVSRSSLMVMSRSFGRPQGSPP